MRGKRRRKRQKILSPRLIPACAGKTRVNNASTRRVRAHPRVCGENFDFCPYRWAGSGSSPRVRGKPRGYMTITAAQRLIPACAGKTRLSRPGSLWRRAHPRVCGENFANLTGLRFGKGSSPRVRGKRQECWLSPGRSRLIPACAGKTSIWLLTSSMRRAHPRVCGENETGEVKERLVFGSSPRVRGKPLLVAFLCCCRGLIPACAGKTATKSRNRCYGSTHPRVCGENSSLWIN